MSVHDFAVNDLKLGSEIWTRLTLDQRSRLLRSLYDTIGETAQEWAEVAAQSKGIGPDHPARGEEWLSGPYAALSLVAALIRTTRALAAGQNPVDGVRLTEAPSGRIRAEVFPMTPTDALLLSGFSGEVWFTPGVSADQIRTGAGLAQKEPGRAGGIGLVLGAGNVTAIPIADVLYELFAYNRVALLKVNPTQDALVPIFRRALAPLIEPGFVRIVTGGADVGAALTAHPDVDHVHITGSAATFDAIVWGTDAQAVQRRHANTPHLTKPITAELGGVSPIIVVPGPWSEADVRFQAEHVVTMRLVNSGHNCIAGQVVLLSSEWPQREQFLRELRAAYQRAPARPVWYPGSDAKLADARASFPDAHRFAGDTRLLVDVGAGDDAASLFETEFFAPVLGVTELPGSGQDFLDAAVARCNSELTGSLGANVLIDPVTERSLGDGFERSITQLHYGAIAINTWTALNFLTPTLTWGGYPGATLTDVSSGIGVVHNALLLADVERSVTRGPFRPFPRAGSALLPRWPAGSGGGVFSLLPKPPWFVTAKTGADVSAGLTRYLIDHNPAALATTFAQAFRG